MHNKGATTENLLASVPKLFPQSAALAICYTTFTLANK